MSFIRAWFSTFVVIPAIQISNFFNDFVLDAVEDESVMVFEARVELNSQSAITVTSF